MTQKTRRPKNEHPPLLTDERLKDWEIVCYIRRREEKEGWSAVQIPGQGTRLIPWRSAVGLQDLREGRVGEIRISGSRLSTSGIKPSPWVRDRRGM